MQNLLSFIIKTTVIYESPSVVHDGTLSTVDDEISSANIADEALYDTTIYIYIYIYHLLMLPMNRTMGILVHRLLMS